MAKNTRSRYRGGSGGAVSLASPVTTSVWGAGGNQVTVLAKHVEGTSATALTLDVNIAFDASTTDGSILVRDLGASDLDFPLAEETVGAAVSGVSPITVTSRQYTFEVNLLDNNLPVITFPISGSGPCNIKLTWTETASAAGTIAFSILSDDV